MNSNFHVNLFIFNPGLDQQLMFYHLGMSQFIYIQPRTYPTIDVSSSRNGTHKTIGTIAYSYRMWKSGS